MGWVELGHRRAGLNKHPQGIQALAALVQGALFQAVTVLQRWNLTLFCGRLSRIAEAARD